MEEVGRMSDERGAEEVIGTKDENLGLTRSGRSWKNIDEYFFKCK